MAGVKQKVILKMKDDTFLKNLQDLLATTGKVKIVGLGVFEIKRMPERNGFDPHRKKSITIPARNKLAFRPSKEFKESVEKYGG